MPQPYPFHLDSGIVKLLSMLYLHGYVALMDLNSLHRQGLVVLSISPSKCQMRLYWLPKLHKKHIKQDLLLVLVLVRQQNLLNCKPHVLQLLKHVIKYCEKVYEGSGKIYFGLLKVQVKF